MKGEFSEMEEKDKPLKVKNTPAFRHSVPVQMRFNDVDVLGHVNNSVYFSFYDLGKSAYFTTVRHGAVDWEKMDVVVANVNCNFYSPIYYGEPVSVVTRVESIRDKSFKMHQRIINTVTNEIKSECATVMVSFDPVSKGSAQLSEKWVKAIKDYEGGNLLDKHSEEEQDKN